MQSATHSFGRLAQSVGGRSLRNQVLSSAAGFYIGTLDDDGLPYSRESPYFATAELAEAALASGSWDQRLSP